MAVHTPQAAADWYRDWPGTMTHAKSACPDAARGFGGLFAATMKEGAISALQKELIALGIGLAQRCEPCILAHAEKCLKLGATPEQLREVAGVAVMMGGGPVYTSLPVLLAGIEAVHAPVPLREKTGGTTGADSVRPGPAVA